MKINKKFLGIIILSGLFIFVAILLFLNLEKIHAVDGSGTNSVSPTSIIQNSTGNAFNFIFTAAETMDSGGISITAPSGWNAPQGVAGSVGYTITTSTGLVADVVNALDSATNWTATRHMFLETSTDVDSNSSPASSFSLSNTIAATAAANEQWYFNYGATSNWGTSAGAANLLRVGMFLKSSVNTASGDFSWQNDDSANIASPLDTVAVPALTANTWTYTSVILDAASRTSVLSYGFRYTNDIGAAILKVDSLSVIFQENDSNNGWSGDGGIADSLIAGSGNFMEGTGAVRCTYGAGAGINTSGDCWNNEGSSQVRGPGTTIGFWVRSNIALNAGDFAWVDDDSTNLGSVLDIVNLPALPANTWTYVVLDAPNSGSMRSFGVRQLVDRGALTIDIDAIGKILDAADATTGWTAPTSVVQTLSSDSSVFHEGAASLKNVIQAETSAGDNWYQTFGSSQNWSNYTTVGFWIRSTVATTAGQLKFEYSSASDLSSPIASINIDALPANTWTYQKLTLSGTRTSVNSYGINYAADIGATIVYLDDVLVGPGSPTFSGQVVNARILSLSAGQTVTVAYGSGGGSNGATAPSATGNYTFTTQSRISDSGTLSNISSSPVVQVIASADTTAPAAISNLAASNATTSTVDLSWISPGDDNNSGTATSYDIRYSTTTIAAGNFASSSQVSGEPAPQIAGTSQSMTVSGLDYSTTYYFAMKTSDEVSNTSAISNVVSLATTNPIPATVSISPASKTAGDSGFTMTVNGTNFISSSVVRFDGSNRDTTFVSSTQLTVSIFTSDLTTAGTFSITVFNPTPGGGSSNSQTFTVNATNPIPTTTGISPSSAVVGSGAFTLTVNGTNFISSSVVRWNGSDRITTYASSTQLTAAITASDVLSVGTAAVTVFNPTPGGGTSNSQTFTISAANPVPVITSISPASASTGSSDFTMTVNGTNFISSSVVRFDGSNRTTTFVDSTQLTASILTSDLTAAGTFSITVFNPTPGGGISNSKTFTVSTANPVPSITSISPNSATAGDAGFTMTVNGTNFISGSVVRFDGNSRTTTFVTSTRLTAIIPSSDIATAGAFPVTVFNPTPGGGSSNSQTFTVNALVINPPTPAISSITTIAGGVNYSGAIFGGQAYPGAKIETLRKLVTLPQFEGASIATFKISDTGEFEIELNYFQQADWLFALQAKDRDGRSARLVAFSQFVPGGNILKFDDIFIPPTIALKEVSVAKTKQASVFGYAAPKAKVQVFVDNKNFAAGESDESGRYRISFSVNSLAEGDHFIKTRYALADGRASDFSNTTAFRVSQLAFPKADFNGDSSVTVADWSIFLFRWGTNDVNLKKTIDLNGDGRSDIADFSVFLQSIKITR